MRIAVVYLGSTGMSQLETPVLKRQSALLRILTLLVVSIYAEGLHKHCRKAQSLFYTINRDTYAGYRTWQNCVFEKHTGCSMRLSEGVL